MQLLTTLFLICLATLAVLHFLALELLLYWRYWWADIVTHLFGGAVVVFGFFALRELRLWPSRWPLTMLTILAGVVCVAVSWEVFWKIMEQFGYELNKDEYVIDTTLDILVGVLGGLGGYWLAERLHNDLSQ